MTAPTSPQTAENVPRVNRFAGLVGFSIRTMRAPAPANSLSTSPLSGKRSFFRTTCDGTRVYAANTRTPPGFMKGRELIGSAISMPIMKSAPAADTRGPKPRERVSEKRISEVTLPPRWAMPVAWMRVTFISCRTR